MRYVIVEQKFNGRFVALRGLSFESEAEAKAHIEASYKPQYRSRFHVEGRAPKANDEGERMHCQCCGRAILAKLGSIAHHGYQRPGGGWQSASCYGAKELPWEVSRDALGRMIEAVKHQLARDEQYLVDLEAEAVPMRFAYSVREKGAFAKPIEKVAKIRREEFEGHELKGMFVRYSVYSFDKLKERNVEQSKRQIKNLKDMLQELVERYESWKPSHRWDAALKNWVWVSL